MRRPTAPVGPTGPPLGAVNGTGLDVGDEGPSCGVAPSSSSASELSFSRVASPPREVPRESLPKGWGVLSASILTWAGETPGSSKVTGNPVNLAVAVTRLGGRLPAGSGATTRAAAAR